LDFFLVGKIPTMRKN